MKYLKTYTLFERVSKETKLFESNLDEYEQIINWKLIDLTDSEFEVSTQKLSGNNGPDKANFIAISIRRSTDAQPREIEGSPNPPGGLYPKEIFVWREVKESVIELISWWEREFNITELSKKNKPHAWKSPISLASGGTYFADACETTDQLINTLEGMGDLISFTVLRIQLQITE